MAKQLFLSPITGTGAFDNRFRPTLEDTVKTLRAAGVAVSSTNWIPVDPVTGHPLRVWALVYVSAKDLRPFQTVPGVHPLPVFPLDGKVSAVQRAKLLALLNKLDDLGIDKSFAVNPDGSIKADGWREVVRGIGRAAGDTSFSEDNFDVPDVTA